jgi:hypothetical protein
MVQERPYEPQVYMQSPNQYGPPNFGALPYRDPDTIGGWPRQNATSGASDLISGAGSLLRGAWEFSPPGMAMSAIQNLVQMLQNYFSNQQQRGGGCMLPPIGGDPSEQYFTNANGGSNGDPHLSFNGASWDNMGSQPDLLHSDSFPGGYQLSTQTTPPGANGVTYNQSATVATNYGRNSISLDKNGNATISQNGYSFQLPVGENMDLENGTFVQRNQDGSLAITSNNGEGGEITTTMKQNGNGVDVNTTANNVDLGGALVNGSGTGGTRQPEGGHTRPIAHYLGN